jgi:hypothetical protein
MPLKNVERERELERRMFYLGHLKISRWKVLLALLIF